MKSSKILGVVLLLAVAAVFGVVVYILTQPKIISPSSPQINKIEISADAKAILNADTKEVIFTIADTQNYLKNAGYFYNPDTFQTTNAKYEGDCFLSAALSNNKDRIIFSTGCLPGDLPQAWVGVYRQPPESYFEAIRKGGKPLYFEKFKFLLASSGRNFVWSQDDKTITYEADLSLSGMTETRMIDSGTGEMLERKSATGDTSDWKTYRNEDYGFEMKYPQSLIMTETRKNGVVDIVDFLTGAMLIDPNLVGKFIIKIASVSNDNYAPSLTIHISEGKDAINRCLTEYGTTELTTLVEKKRY